MYPTPVSKVATGGHSIPRSVDILGVRIDDVTYAEALALLSRAIETRTPHVVTTPNPEFVMLARRDAGFRAALESRRAEYPRRHRPAAGGPAGGRPAARARPGHRPGPHAGRRVGQARRALVPARRLRRRRCTRRAGPRTRLPGPGRWPARRLAHPLADGRRSDSRRDPRARAESTCCWSPTARPNKSTGSIATWPSWAYPVGIGVGGVFNYLSGDAPRAPVWVRRVHFEWLHRLISQPWRWRRQLALPGFAALAVADAIPKRLAASPALSASASTGPRLRALVLTSLSRRGGVAARALALIVAARFFAIAARAHRAPLTAPVARGIDKQPGAVAGAALAHQPPLALRNEHVGSRSTDRPERHIQGAVAPAPGVLASRMRRAGPARAPGWSPDQR